MAGIPAPGLSGWPFAQSEDLAFRLAIEVGDLAVAQTLDRKYRDKVQQPPN